MNHKKKQICFSFTNRIVHHAKQKQALKKTFSDVPEQNPFAMKRPKGIAKKGLAGSKTQ